MGAISDWIVRHPVWALLIALALTLSLAGGMGRLHIDASANGLLVPSSPGVKFYQEVRSTFGDDVMLTVVLAADDLFRPEVLQAIRDLTDDGAAIDGVSRVVSLATVSKLSGEGGVLVADDLLGEIPEDPEGLAKLRQDALDNELLVGEVIGRDGHATAIHLFLESRPQEVGFDDRLVAEVEKLLVSYRARLGPGVEIYQVGNPFLEVQVLEHIRRDLMVLAPACVVAILLVLLLVFRSGVAMMLPALSGLLSVVAALGFMGYMGIAVSPVTSMIPSLLLVVGCTEDIHLIAEYARGLRAGKSRDQAVLEMGRSGGLAGLLTSLTTWFGFASIIPTRVPMLRDFGIASSFGIAINFVLTILLLPAILKLLPRLRALARPEEDVLGGLRKVLLGMALHRRGAVAAVWTLACVFFLVGYQRLVVDTNYLTFFRHDSAVRRTYDEVSRQLVGALSFVVVVDTGAPGGVNEPRALADVAKLDDYLAGRFEKISSYVDTVRKLNMELAGGDRAAWRIPDSAEMVSQLALMIDPDEAARFVDFDARRTALLVRTRLRGSRELTAIQHEIEAFAHANLSHDLEVQVTGQSILIAQASDTISRSLVVSLSSSILAIFVAISLLFFSIKAGLLAMVPNLIPVLVNFGFMGWVGIPLSMATFPVAVIALGIAVDDTIHFMVRFSQELKGTSDNRRAITRTIVHELRPIVTTSVALVLGFSTLMLGRFASTAQFGVLAALAMLVALLADLTATPALLATTPLISAWDLLRLRISNQVLERSPLFRRLSRAQVKRVALLGDLRRHQEGDLLLRQGEEGEDLLVLLSGSARIVVREAHGDRQREIGAVEPGDVVGEMAFFTKGVRSASVLASGACETLQIDGARLERIERRFPRIAARVYFNLSQLLSTKLGRATAWLSEAPPSAGDSGISGGTVGAETVSDSG